MICPKCEREIPDDSRFCPECGERFQISEDINESTMNTGSTKRCVSCGYEMPADSRFCPECRSRQPDVPNSVASPQMGKKPSISVNQQLTAEEEARLKKRNKIIALVAVSALGLCLIIGLFSVLIKPSINLNNYLSVTFDGYDSVGKASVSFDREKFKRDYGSKLSAFAQRNGTSNSWASTSSNSASDAFISKCVNGSLDSSDNLKNGDVVTFRWDCDDDYALNAYGYKLKYKDAEFTVKNLKEAKKFDPFDGISVSFQGVAPNGTASIVGSPKEQAANDLNYYFDKSSDLSNGETVIVTVSAHYNNDPVEYCIQNYGMIPSPLSKQYKVDGLSSYIASLNDVSQEALAQMQKQAEDVYYSKAAQNWGEGETIESFTYIGDYLLVNKSNNDYYGSSRNALFLVYDVKVKNDYVNGSASYHKTNDILWYIAFYNLLVDNNGTTTVDITNSRTPSDRFTIDSGISSGWWSTKTWYYYGYKTLNELYKVVVTANAEKYSHEDNVDESLIVATENEQVPVVMGEDGIIFPNSSVELLDENKLKNLTKDELQYAINELCARHGYIFKDDVLRAYYERYDWYEKTVKPEDFSTSLFNDIEKKNFEMLQKERDGRN